MAGVATGDFIHGFLQADFPTQTQGGAGRGNTFIEISVSTPRQP